MGWAMQNMLAMVVLGGAGAVAEPREVELTIRVLDPAGAPLAGVDVVVERSPLRGSLPTPPAATDADGVASVKFHAEPDEGVVRVDVLDAPSSQLGDEADDDILSLGFVGAMMDIKERCEVRSFDAIGYPLSLDGGEDVRAFSIQARPMTIQPGIALDMTHMYIQVRGDSGSMGSVVETDGHFDIRVPKGSAKVWLSAPELMSPIERYIPRSPDETPIVVSRADFETSDAPGRLTVAKTRLLEMFSVQLVRLDGQFGALATFGPKPEWGNLDSLGLPAGTYYILHYGELFAFHGLDIALHTIHDGDGSAALALLPTIEIRPGESGELNLSLEEIECATRNFVHAALFAPNSVEAMWPPVEEIE